MYFGADYHPEHWVFPYAGTAEEPESRWKRDIELMVGAGINVVRMGEFCWGVCEPREGEYNFTWMRRVMDLMADEDIKVVLGTPTAAPPIWLARNHPEILPVDERGLPLCEGTRHACCLNSDLFWEYSKRIVRAMGEALGKHKQLIAWQIDNNVGAHTLQPCFNDETRRDWQAWLQTKYQTLERLNEMLGTRFWGQVITDWAHVPTPRVAPAPHNPALMLDWKRFTSDTVVAYVRMQAELLRELTPHAPVTTNMRAFGQRIDLFDMAGALDFASLNSNATIKSKAAENACEIDFLRSLKKTDVKIPGAEDGFWVIEQKAGHVNWQEVNSLVRPDVVRLFTYQTISRGANGVLYFFWRQPRIGPEKFYGGILTHDGRGENRIYKEISQIGSEVRRLTEALKGTRVQADVCILYSHDNDWTLSLPRQPTRHFNLREHVQLFHTALHDRNMAVDFARPTEDLSKYKLVIAPSLHLLAGGEADALKLYVQNGGTLVGTCNFGLVDEHLMAPESGYPHDLTDVFGLEVTEFDPLPPEEENHLAFKGANFHTSHLHAARHWCDVIEPKGCQVLATYTRDFYAGRPALTLNEFGDGKAVYVGTMSHQLFYYDLVSWLRNLCRLQPLLKVPDTVEVSLRQSENTRIYFLLNHQSTPVRINFFKPMHDFLTGRTFSGNYDLAPHGVLVLDEHSEENPGPAAEGDDTEIVAEEPAPA
ncbi:MAG TPA: beta-galactosidase [Verrucomicrobiae bacterium]|jgi:beta-galactosidase|nr:beta-galactosidase [Verrucomicrobiae bacterium]